MPRVNGIMQPLPNTYGQPGRPIESAKYNTQLDDLIADANAARPITAGGTGAHTPEGARDGLGVTQAITASEAKTKDLYLAKTEKQANRLDATADRLLTVGAFGLGGIAPPALPNNDANVSLPAGSYSVQQAWTGSPFAGVHAQNYGTLVVIPWTATYQMQVHYPANLGPVLVRQIIGNNIYAWREMTNPADATDAEADAGTVVANRSWSPARIWRAVRACLPLVSQAEAEAGTSVADRRWTPQRVRQATAAWAMPITGGTFTGIIRVFRNLPTIGLHYPGVFSGEWVVAGDGSLWWRTQDGNTALFRIGLDGAVSTPQLGDFYNRIEDRAAGWARQESVARANERVNEIRTASEFVVGDDVDAVQAGAVMIAMSIRSSAPVVRKAYVQSHRVDRGWATMWRN